MDQLPVGDPTLSAKEIVGNESQERMGIVIREEDIEHIRQIADRERAPFYVVGETTGDHRFVFEQTDGVKPIDLAMEDMFRKAPRTVMTDRTVEETYEDVTYDQTQLDEYVERVLQLEAVACNRLAHQQSGPFRYRKNCPPTMSGRDTTPIERLRSSCPRLSGTRRYRHLYRPCAASGIGRSRRRIYSLHRRSPHQYRLGSALRRFRQRFA